MNDASSVRRWRAGVIAALALPACLACARRRSGPAPAPATAPAPAAAATAPVAEVVVDSIPAHDSFTVQSRALGEARRINVYTPPSYRSAAEGAAPRLPVLYMPDGGLDED